MKLPSLRSKAILATATLVLALAGSVYSQSDDFNDGNDNGWTRYQPLAPFGAPGTYSFPSGGYRIQAAASPNPGALGPGRAGSILDGTNYAAFMVSVDLVAWDNNLVQTFGLVARIAQPGLGTSDGYYLHYNPQNTPGVGAFTLDRIDNESPFELNGVDITLNPALDYRMVLTGIGSMLTAQIFALTDLITPLASFTATDSTYASGSVGLLTAGQVPQGATSATDATFDNFSAAVPEPSTVLLFAAGAALVGLTRRTLTRRWFHRILILTTICCAHSASANLVSNSGFETGDFTGWTLGGSAGAVDTFSANSGTYGAFFSNSPPLAVISQSLTTVAGGSYDLSFFLANRFAEGSGTEIVEVRWDGNLIFTLTNPAPFDYTQFSFAGLLATGSSSVLEFSFQKGLSFFRLDDVVVTQGSVTAVPETFSTIWLSLPLAVFVLLGLRGRQSLTR